MDLEKYIDMFDFIHQFQESLVDEESKIILEARLRWLVNKDFYESTNVIFSLNELFDIHGMNNVLQYDSNIENIIIWGAGKEGIYCRKLVNSSIYKDMNVFFFDRNSFLVDKKIDDCKVLSISEIKRILDYSIVIISSFKYRYEILDDLQMLLFPLNRVIIPNMHFGGHIYGYKHNQYFDFFEPYKNEVFLDVGCLNGGTSVEFVKWASFGYGYIYAFEANKKMTDTINNTIKSENINNFQLFNIGVWSSHQRLTFNSLDGMYAGGACINQNGDEYVEVDTLDNMLEDVKRITFVKMDIEGSEYDALRGAEKLIKKHMPRMAISVYHHPEDILTIPKLIYEYNCSYRFALRQYGSNMNETILYAWV